MRVENVLLLVSKAFILFTIPFRPLGFACWPEADSFKM